MIEEWDNYVIEITFLDGDWDQIPEEERDRFLDTLSDLAHDFVADHVTPDTNSHDPAGPGCSGCNVTMGGVRQHVKWDTETDQEVQ